MKALTTKKERTVVMKQLRTVFWRSIPSSQLGAAVPVMKMCIRDSLGLAGVGQYKAGILVGLLAGLGAGLLFRHSLSHQAGGVAFFQFVGKVEVAPVSYTHLDVYKRQR